MSESLSRHAQVYDQPRFVPSGARDHTSGAGGRIRDTSTVGVAECLLIRELTTVCGLGNGSTQMPQSPSIPGYHLDGLARR